MTKPTKPNISCGHCGAAVRRPPSEIAKYKDHFCNLTCKGAAQAAKSLAAFWSKTKLTPTGCIEWQLHTDKDGYGRTKTSQRELGAHQLAWELTNGSIANGLHVLHVCDNPPCVNPEHLFLGTNQDNTDDRVKKGRQCGPPRKVTPEIASAIRKSSDTHKAIAAQFGVSEITVWRYRNERSNEGATCRQCCGSGETTTQGA